MVRLFDAAGESLGPSFVLFSVFLNDQLGHIAVGAFIFCFPP